MSPTSAPLPCGARRTPRWARRWGKNVQWSMKAWSAKSRQGYLPMNCPQCAFRGCLSKYRWVFIVYMFRQPPEVWSLVSDNALISGTGKVGISHRNGWRWWANAKCAWVWCQLGDKNKFIKSRQSASRAKSRHGRKNMDWNRCQENMGLTSTWYWCLVLNW